MKPNEPPRFELVVATLPASGFLAAMRPDEAGRAAIAETLGVTRFEMLEVDFLVRRWRRDGAEVTGEIRARLEQPCVVSLEPVVQELRESVRATFLPAGSKGLKPKPASDLELAIDPESDDPPEPFEGDSIELWAIAIEWLALAIDPFPRSPHAQLAGTQAPEERAEEPREPSPFAALARLKPSAD